MMVMIFLTGPKLNMRIALMPVTYIGIMMSMMSEQPEGLEGGMPLIDGMTRFIRGTGRCAIQDEQYIA